MTRILRLSILALAALLSACQSPTKYEREDYLYFEDNPDALLQAYAEAEQDSGRDGLLGRMKLLSAYLLKRDWSSAEALALEVSTGVNTFIAGQTGEGDALSTFGTERSKTFKGEPFERAMADFYLGLLRYRRHDYEGALACFRSALAKDHGSFLLPVEKQRARDRGENVERHFYDSDLALFEFLAAKCWAQLDEERQADAALDRAKSLDPNLAALYDRGFDARYNVLVIVETGRAPKKTQTGRGGSTLGYRRAPEIYVDRVAMNDLQFAFGKTDDLYEQAITLGRRRVDSLNKIKADRQYALQTIGKTTAIGGTFLALAGGRRSRGLRNMGLIGLGAGLTTLLVSETIDAEADTRSWSTLPGGLVLAIGQAPLGAGQKLEIDVRGVGARETWTLDSVDVAAGENLIWARIFGVERSYRR